jgi:hypothetical protein
MSTSDEIKRQQEFERHRQEQIRQDREKQIQRDEELRRIHDHQESEKKLNDDVVRGKPTSVRPDRDD